MQVNSDWFQRMTKKQAEHELANLKFNGPGLYLSNTDTLIVIPDTEEPSWKQNWPDDQYFIFYVFNTTFENTIMGSEKLPVRVDSRS